VLDRFAPGDLVIVWARLRDCPGRLRLLDVGRLAEAPLSLLDLDPVPVVGRTSIEVQTALEQQYHAQVPGRPVPPIRVAPPQHGADAQAEVLWLQHAEEELETCWREPLERPDRLPNRLYERIAAR
jgi:hypothetical protein